MKKAAVFAMLLMVSIVMTSCSFETFSKSKHPVSQENKDETAANFPMTITDQAGREIVLEKPAERIVSSYYITTSALMGLGLNDKIVGLESEPERRPIYAMCDEDLLNRTQVGSPKEFDIEVCAKTNPDLVILPMRAKDYVEPLEELGITVMVVNPEGQQLILDMLRLIGKATAADARAEELCSHIRYQSDYIERKISELEKPTVYLGGNSSFLSTASQGMYQNDQINIAGGVNVAGDIDDTYWVESSYEQILAWNPQAIILASDAKYSLEDVLKDESLADCQAVKDGKVFAIPSDYEAWDSPVPSSFLGAAYMASVLHPDAFTNDDYQQMVEEFYEKFYGISFN